MTEIETTTKTYTLSTSRITAMTTTTKASREYDSAVTGLSWAEDLRDLLAARYAEHKNNGYYLDALDRANALVNEMDENLDDVMSRYTPEECGL